MKHLRCVDCRELRPLDAFPVDLTKRSGRKGFCQACRPPEPKAPEPPPIPARVVDAMCKSKVRYRSHGIALAVATKAARRTTLMRVYRCPICNGWHLTHKAPRGVTA